MFRYLPNYLVSHICADAKFSIIDLLFGNSSDVWTIRAARNALDPGFPQDDPPQYPKKPARPLPTDVPMPTPMDVPVPDPEDVPVPDPGTIPTPAKPKPKNHDPKPRSVP